MGTVTARLTGAHKSYRHAISTRTVLNGLNLSVETGEFLVLVGPSGCGKSTLLRVLAGLESLEAGTIEWPTEGPDRPHTGMVFQQPLLMPWLTVRQNVGLGGRYKANRERFDATYAEELLSRFGLSEFAASYPDQLSGGQAQRVAVARAVAPHPQLLLLDEPFAALDPATRHGLQEWLRGLTGTLELTTVLVTHDVDEALSLGDRIAPLDGSGTIPCTWSNQGVPDSDARPLREQLLAHYQSKAGTQQVVAGRA